jgi:hypothetical protein
MEQENNTPKLERGLLTDAAIVAGPSAAVVLNHYLSRPKPPEPPKIELPPGTSKPE